MLGYQRPNFFFLQQLISANKTVPSSAGHDKKGCAMNQPTVSENSGNSGTTARLVPQDSTPTLHDDFWKDFCLFPLKLDEWGSKHWYFLLGGAYCLFFIAVVLSSVFDGKIVGTIFSPEYELFFTNYWLLILLGIGLALINMSFNYWRGNIPEVFGMLLSKERIRSKNKDGNVDREFRQFLDEYKHTLLRGGGLRYSLVGFSTILSAILLLIPAYLLSLSSPLSGIQWGVVLLFVGLPGLILGYLVGISAWTMFVTGFQVRAIPSRFDLVIEPSHPDNCGGLRSLGNFCLSMLLPIVIGVVFCGIFIIGGVLYPFLIHGQQILLLAAAIEMLVFDGPLAAVAFFVPLWRIHQEMVAEKESYQERFANYVAKLEKKVWTSLEQGAVADAEAAKKERDIIQVLNPNAIGYPAWPFDRQIVAYIYLLPQAVPILSLVLPSIMQRK